MTDLLAIWRKHASAANVLQRRPDFRFDPDFYGRQWPDLGQDPEALRAHYERHGKAKGAAPSLYIRAIAERPDLTAVVDGLIVDPDIRQAIASGDPEALHLAFELMHLGPPVDARISDFSLEAYLDTYPDIGSAGVDALIHYLAYGVKEGRQTLKHLLASQHHGRGAYSADRPTCLIGTHELSRTGAPIVTLDLVREASRTHNVIVASLKDGPLLDSFLEYACEVVIVTRPLGDFRHYRGEVFSRIDFAIVNSVEAWSFIPFLVAQEIPFASYVHEYVHYVLPTYKSTFTGLFADLVVFSSEHVRDSWAGRLKDIEFDTARDSTIVRQRNFSTGGVDALTLDGARARLSNVIGRDLSNVRLICGAGHLQWRKGTDIFTMVAQICRDRDPNTVFVWIGDGLNFEDISFGVWMKYHMKQAGADKHGGNLFFLPAGPAYQDLIAASDAMLVSSRLDPLPNVVFDALDAGCHIVQFEGASGFGDSLYAETEHFTSVEYGNPLAAAEAILSLPRKAATAGVESLPPPRLFGSIRKALEARLAAQRYFVRGASQIDVPVLYTSGDGDRPLRVREREKMLRYRRRFVWRDLADVEEELASSDNWTHKRLRLLPYEQVPRVPETEFSIHVHAYYTDELGDDLKRYRAYRLAKRIVFTTDTERKADEIRRIAASEELSPEVVIVPNRGRDILPFMELFAEGGAAGDDEVWCHLHQKKSLATVRSGDVWRTFLMRILLGDEKEISTAINLIGQDGIGLVAPFDPYFIPWNASRELLPRFVDRLSGPLPDNPLLLPVGNMFWIRRSVVLAMRDLFGHNYPWPNEPIPDDGTEFHLIERLWPAVTTQAGLDSVFVHKLDQKRV
ncbi:rhamnan synthesis F family protein [Mesorhizobium australicum]|uniref:Rhamnan synthesis protein F n=1 Tax=Mesorhizobium australicum TaxID=536018 RepID=A0A1X7PZD5_9HYPH|nr:rhamnan synthesis F family protein [Mesorhizobium australicum]SMH56883.1 Rhamnan synthesis protein F [Mesorhizobium australicum]